MRRGDSPEQAWEVTGWGPVWAGSQGQLRLGRASWVGVVGGGVLSLETFSLGKSICACPRQGTGAQLGVHTTSHAFPLTPWGRQDPAPVHETPHPKVTLTGLPLLWS